MLIVTGQYPSPVLDQYSWHISPAEVRAASVVLAYNDSDTDYFQSLRAIGPGEIRQKQRQLAEVSLKLQYSIPPPQVKKWSAPFKDAFEIILDNLFIEAEAHIEK